MPTLNVDLTEHEDSFITAGIEAGRYTDANEAVRSALHLLEQQEQEDQAKFEWLRNTTQEAFAALDRGEGVPLGDDVDMQTFVSEAVAEARAKRNPRQSL